MKNFAVPLERGVIGIKITECCGCGALVENIAG